MKLSFFSNYLTHHQIPFSNEMYSILGENYTFISTQSMDEERKEEGWKLSESYPYELKAYESDEAHQKALRLAKESDVIIIGSAPEEYVKKRMDCLPEGITFRYSERIYKCGRWRILSPRGLLLRYQTYFKYHNQNIYMLCSSAYTSGDLRLLGSYLGRCYKWGYFPKTISYNLDELMKQKAKEKAEILWCGRLIPLKHPEEAIFLAHRLNQNGFDFHMNIIGTGELKDTLMEMISRYNLSSFVSLSGLIPAEKVRGYMEKADILLFTSDFHEGWGAVVNEAMNSGCAVVVSHAAGCAPYLIKDGSNGFLYKSGDVDSLYIKLKELLLNRPLREELGRNAYETITCEWNAKEAAGRLLLLIDDLKQTKSSSRYGSGPCSKAEIIKNNWYGEG